MSTENVAFMRLGQIETGAQRLERERRDLELRAAMVGVIADAHRSAPLDRPGFAPPAPTPGSNNGWRTAPPLAVPGGDATQRIIDAMVHAMQPHGVGNPQRPAALEAVGGPGATEPPTTAEPAPISAAAEAKAPPAAAEVTRRRLT
jgi:hypothetical protein